MEECHFFIVIFTASGLSVLCTPLQVFSFLASSVIFCATMFESIFGRLHVEQHCRFRDLVIRPWRLLQAPSLLNDNSLLKTFLQRSIIWLYAIVMSLYHSYVVTFYIWSLYFVYGKNKEKKIHLQPNSFQANAFFLYTWKHWPDAFLYFHGKLT